MKLLLDENLSRRLVPFLQHDYPDTSQVVLLGMSSATDKEVWQRAKADGYVIVTRDADFQELSLVWGQPPQVIRLKTPNQTRAATLKILLDNREAIIDALGVQNIAAMCKIWWDRRWADFVADPGAWLESETTTTLVVATAWLEELFTMRYQQH